MLNLDQRNISDISQLSALDNQPDDQEVLQTQIFSLSLAYNRITSCVGLTSLQNLTKLVLHHNAIESLVVKVMEAKASTPTQPLLPPAIRYLDVAHNALSSLVGLEHLLLLEHLDVSHNRILSTVGLPNLNAKLLLMPTAASGEEEQEGSSAKRHSSSSPTASSSPISSSSSSSPPFFVFKASCNLIEKTSSLVDCLSSSLYELDLTDNKIETMKNIAKLGDCRMLANLKVGGNPIVTHHPQVGAMLAILLPCCSVDIQRGLPMARSSGAGGGGENGSIVGTSTATNKKKKKSPTTVVIPNATGEAATATERQFYPSTTTMTTTTVPQPEAAAAEEEEEAFRGRTAPSISPIHHPQYNNHLREVAGHEEGKEGGLVVDLTAIDDDDDDVHNVLEQHQQQQLHRPPQARSAIEAVLMKHAVVVSPTTASSSSYAAQQQQKKALLLATPTIPTATTTTPATAINTATAAKRPSSSSPPALPPPATPAAPTSLGSLAAATNGALPTQETLMKLLTAERAENSLLQEKLKESARRLRDVSEYQRQLRQENAALVVENGLLAGANDKLLQEVRGLGVRLRQFRSRGRGGNNGGGEDHLQPYDHDDYLLPTRKMNGTTPTSGGGTGTLPHPAATSTTTKTAFVNNMKAGEVEVLEPSNPNNKYGHPVPIGNAVPNHLAGGGVGSSHSRRKSSRPQQQQQEKDTSLTSTSTTSSRGEEDPSRLQQTTSTLVQQLQDQLQTLEEQVCSQNELIDELTVENDSLVARLTELLQARLQEVELVGGAAGTPAAGR